MVAAAFALALPVLASADVIFNGTVPISGTVTNPCNGELVDFSGTLHEVISETFDSSGGIHFDDHFNIHVTATGETTGTNYVGNQEEHLTENFNSGGSITVTEPFTFSEISKGSAPNFIEHALYHVTVNPDGTVTSFIDTYSAECRG